MKTRRAESCWSEQAVIVALPPKGEAYLDLIRTIHDRVPDSWSRLSAWLHMSRDGRNSSGIGATCGAVEEAGEEDLRIVRNAMLDLCLRSLIPQNLPWISVSIALDLEHDRMSATLVAGPLPPPAKEKAFPIGGAGADPFLSPANAAHGGPSDGAAQRSRQAA